MRIRGQHDQAGTQQGGAPHADAVSARQSGPGMANNRPDAVTHRAVQETVQLSRRVAQQAAAMRTMHVNSGRGDPASRERIVPVQRMLGAAEAGQTPFAEDAGTLAAKQKVQSLSMGKLSPADIDIVDAALTAGNCHGLTFGGGGDTVIEHDDLEEFAEHWKGNKIPGVVLCIMEGRVAHSAKKNQATGTLLNTFPGGPVFSCTLETLKSAYPVVLDLDVEEKVLFDQAWRSETVRQGEEAEQERRRANMIKGHRTELKASESDDD